MSEIHMANGRVALCDPEDVEMLSKHSWFYSTGYAYTRVNGKQIAMHNMVKPPLPGRINDHENDNGLDNRKANLKPMTYGQNIHKGRKSTSYTGEPYITYDKRKNRYYLQRTNQWGGSFRTLAEAVAARPASWTEKYQ